jgi:hypothetical protein
MGMGVLRNHVEEAKKSGKGSSPGKAKEGAEASAWLSRRR